MNVDAEAYLIKLTTITIKNMMDHLHYADAKNCALLMEVVMDFVVENGDEVNQKVALKDAP